MVHNAIGIELAPAAIVLVGARFHHHTICGQDALVVAHRGRAHTRVRGPSRIDTLKRRSTDMERTPRRIPEGARAHGHLLRLLLTTGARPQRRGGREGEPQRGQKGEQQRFAHVSHAETIGMKAALMWHAVGGEGWSC
eukprot:TRINITY_DN36343_c0_g2_i1.p2 TRINITY_DN36343_c0_g2~~TRINITY_DN36343_c0_g2_i1.p2  ORF type:complete len:138 (-),score=10.20 TRINITY_DN36343_c0_g2_i1:157-570(-)